jgi:hypothetical protein
MGIQINTQPQVFTSLSSSAISATNLFNNSGIDIISRTNTLFTTVTGITGSSLTSPSLSAQTLTAGSGVFNTSISATAISAVKFYGDGSELKNIAGVGAGVTSVNGITGVVTNVAFTISANNFTQGLTGTSATFTASVSSPAISGTNFYTTSAGGYLSGGTNLTGIFGAKSIVDSTFTTVSGITANRLNTPILSSQTLTALSATFTISVSSPAISGTNFYTTSAGGYLSGGTNLTGIFGAKTTVDSTFTTVSNITSTRLNTPVLSSQSLSTNTLTISGYPITPVTTVYSVANGATATYVVALSDNNNTLTLNLGTSGIVALSGTYPVGFQTNVIQLSTGRITLSAVSPITLNNDLSSYRTYGRYSAATIINLGSAWVCYGSLSS